ncbi:MAG TPA: transglycosylase domain-containing protein, partial [Bacilli bacterium]
MSDSSEKTPTRSGNREQGLPEWPWFTRARKWFSLLFTLMVIALFAGLLFILYLRTQALPVSSVTQTSQIIDLHGDVIDAFNIGQNRQSVSLQRISPWLVKATIAIEDHRFYDHRGLDMKGIARAAWVDVLHMSRKQGASTLTQQLARNLYLTQERTWTRKAKEAVYAIQLEMQFTKDEILTQYLNQIYYGHGAYGIQAASQLYYGKNAVELNLAESAMLAGIPKGWKYYSPHRDYARAKERQRTILRAMADFGEITPQAADDAYRELLVIQPLTAKVTAHAPYFRDYIRKLAEDKLGINEHAMDSGGITIYTTLDLKAQRIAEEVIAEQLAGNEEIQAALIAIDPRTGYVKAMVGGQRYPENQYNRVFANTRQPGSSFKPILY